MAHPGVWPTVEEERLMRIAVLAASALLGMPELAESATAATPFDTRSATGFDKLTRGVSDAARTAHRVQHTGIAL
jgi:hypothetical protein